MPNCLVIFFSFLMGNSLAMAGFELADSHYDAGNFSAAVEAYQEALLDNRDKPGLFFNLGNAFWRSEQPAEAMAAYLAAKRLAPRDPDVIANLATVRKGAKDDLEIIAHRPLWVSSFFWVDSLSAKEMAYGAALACLTFWLALALGIWRRISLLFWLSGGAAVLGLVLWMSVLLKSHFDQPWGAIRQAKARVYSGPSESGNKALFELKLLAPAQVLEERGSWYRILLSDGKKGWVAGESLAVYLD